MNCARLLPAHSAPTLRSEMASTRVAVGAIARWWWSSPLRRWISRIVVLWHVTGALMLVLAPMASAAPPEETDPGKPVDSTAGYFGWMEVKDSAGINVWNYKLEIGSGGWRNPGKTFFSLLTKLEFEAFRFVTASAIWFLGWVLSFSWLDTLTSPVQTLGDSLQSIVDSFGLTSLLLAVAAFMAGIWVLRGRYATGIFEFLTAVMIASVSVVLLSNPVARVAGDDGMLIKARDTGMELAVGLKNNGNTSSGSATDDIKNIQATLADSMVRKPTQMLNFGAVLDDANTAQCVKEWDKSQREGKNVVAKVEAGCKYGKNLAYNAKTPDSAQAFGGFALDIFGAVFVVFSFVVAASLLMAAAWALAAAVKFIVASVAGIMAGPGRDMWWRCLTTVAMTLLLVVFMCSFVVGYMLVIDAFFSSGDNVIAKFMYVDVAMILGVILARRAVTAMRSASERLADKLASARPGPSAPSSINRNPGSLGAVTKVAHASQAAAGVSRLARGAGSATSGAASGVGSAVAKPVRGLSNKTSGPTAGRVQTDENGDRQLVAFGSESKKGNKDAGQSSKTKATNTGKGSADLMIRGLGHTGEPIAVSPASGPQGVSTVKQQVAARVLERERSNRTESRPGIRRPVRTAPRAGTPSSGDRRYGQRVRERAAQSRREGADRAREARSKVS